MMKSIMPFRSVTSLLAREVSLLGEKMGEAMAQCRNSKEEAALEDALQNLARVKSTLDKAVN
ncbi:hypothetical protein [Providencia sp. PROV018]|uniref:hypothetical protein n=2 Tax=Morganellaceae TaxID=1903414 RepID=UPI002349AA12|nr:hypothetical protein [Providencia sp. PROV018]